MKLEQQVVALKLAKKLWMLGVKQSSLFYYQGTRTELDTGKGYMLDYGKTIQYVGAMYISAFTVAELGKMLPHFIKSDWLKEQYCNIANNIYPHFDPDDLSNEFRVDTWGDADGNKHCSLNEIDTETLVSSIGARTEANARAKMLIYLIENKLIDVKSTS